MLQALLLPTTQTKKRLGVLIQLTAKLNEISQPLLRLVAYFIWLSTDFPDYLPRREKQAVRNCVYELHFSIVITSLL